MCSCLALGTCCLLLRYNSGVEGVCTAIFQWALPPGDILLFSGPCDLHYHLLLLCGKLAEFEHAVGGELVPESASGIAVLISVLY